MEHTVTQSQPFTIALAQTGEAPNGDVLAQVRAATLQAKDQGASIVAFPEFLMTPYELDAQSYAQAAEPLDGAFASAMSSLAAEMGLWILFTMNEKNPVDPTKPFNTAILVDNHGKQCGIYRKTHLFDAGNPAESDRMTPGSSLFEPLATPFGTIGLGICYDLRFPELARAAALAGCDVMFYPAGWVDGPTKVEQWETLLRARAIENEMHVVGICRAGKGYTGHSILIAPNGTVLAQTNDNDPQILVAEIDPSATKKMRETIPVFHHRRPSLYT